MHDPYEELANAIIIKAVEDYRNAGCCHKEKNSTKKGVIRFFHSQLFADITKIDPIWLEEKLEREDEAGRKELVEKAEKAYPAGTRIRLLVDSVIDKETTLKDSEGVVLGIDDTHGNFAVVKVLWDNDDIGKILYPRDITEVLQ